MSQCISVSEPVSNSLSITEESLSGSDVPEEALCVAFTDSSITSSGERCCDSPGMSITSNDESVDSFVVDTTKIITKEMAAEEKRLHSEAIQEEEKRKEEETMLLQQMTDQTREQRYERLKYLLSKSTMYTEYLVGRIKKQKEEEEKRKERLLKRTIKKQELQTKKEQERETAIMNERGGESTKGQARQTRLINKRKVGDVENEGISGKPKAKRQKKNSSKSSSSGPQDNVTETEKSESELSKTENETVERAGEELDITTSIQPDSINNNESIADEPELIEKASTFGVIEEEEEKRVIDGEVVPFLQPKLLDGGVLRPYQVEGYSWLKVLYENGVNGILADEMGLGKTIQCVAILAHLVYMGVPGPFLICAPLSTIPNWFAEFARFAPKVPTVLYHGNKDSRTHLASRIRYKHKIREGVNVQPVVITSYEIAMIDRRYLANYEWKYLVVDEGHRIKNTHCRLIRELRMYRSTHRLLLTGTPLQNSLAELWSLLNFLLPEIFDDLGSFEAWFDVGCISDADSEKKILAQERTDNILSILHQILSPFMLRRLKSDVDLNIPPKKEILVFAPMTQQQKDFYSALVDKTIFGLLDQNSNEEEKVDLAPSGRPKRKAAIAKVEYSLMMESDAERKEHKMTGRKQRWRYWKDQEQEEKELESWVQAVSMRPTTKMGLGKKQKTTQVTIKMRNVMMQMRKCCNHPYLLEHPLNPKTGDLAFTEEVITSSGKMLLLDKMLAELKKRGHRVLIFSQMTRMLDLIEDFCQMRDYDFCRLDGSTQMENRRQSVSVFNENKEDKFLFLLSTRAGGLGINLTGADTVIIYDSDWNPQCDLQAQDRCHRIGQTKPVVVYRFVTVNTIDQKIIERAAAKRKLEKMIIHRGKFKTGNFMAKAKPISPEELQDLLQSKDHDIEVKGDGFVISEDSMNSLLDRSDLIEKWKKGSGNDKGKDVQPVADIKPLICKASKRNTKRGKGKNQSKETLAKPSQLFKILDTDDSIDTSNSISNDDTHANVAAPLE